MFFFLINKNDTLTIVRTDAFDLRRSEAIVTVDRDKSATSLSTAEEASSNRQSRDRSRFSQRSAYGRLVGDKSDPEKKKKKGATRGSSVMSDA